MKIDVWGCRGSIPSPGPETNKYGGNTSCVQCSYEGVDIILDGGSGIQRLGHHMDKRPTDLHIFLTHLHMDHTMGLGFFMPLYDPNVQIHIWGPQGSGESLLKRLRRYFSPPLFPVRMNELPKHPIIHELHEGWHEVEGFRILSKYVCHPGPTMGFRVEAGGKSFTYMPDHEIRIGAPNFPNSTEWMSGYELAHKTDLLFHDAQYTRQEYDSRVGWGHSSMIDAIQFAECCEVGELQMFHHDPGRTDDQLDELERGLRNEVSSKLNYSFCKEETIIDL